MCPRTTEQSGSVGLVGPQRDRLRRFFPAKT
jgi:hypothetical protein